MEYTYRENLFNLSQDPSVIHDEHEQDAFNVRLYYSNGTQKVLTQGLGRVTNGATNIFNIAIESRDASYHFVQKPLYQNLIGTKWDVYHDHEQIGLLKTKLDVTKDKMWLELDGEDTVVFESTKLSETTFAYVNDQEIMKIKTQRFSPASQHSVEIQTQDWDHALLLGIYQTFYTFLETTK
ncbi:hypothetical protein [Halobacillus campisalis]|uniref:Tubby C-terminal domain-containing protein n=1 Tax=Halobacillus campisalis TaxID=435909 RepID=A0ABW2K1W9_9BACI|nr:hypothetical protein [Halobacillus campisalis]